MQNRAKIFHSFDSLKGYKDYIKEKEKIVVGRKEICEDECIELDRKIKQVKKGRIITVVYYDTYEYVKITGMVVKIDLEYLKQIQIVDKKINIKDIVEIVFENMK